MEQNKDGDHIHMARNMFDRLLAVAEGGSTNERDLQEIRNVLYHVREYNPVFKEEQRISREEKQAYWRMKRNAVVAFFKQWYQKPAYVIVDEEYFKIAFIERNSNKLSLTVQILDWRHWRFKRGVFVPDQIEIVPETKEIKDHMHQLLTGQGEARRFFETTADIKDKK
jgi:hypothetical protein